MKKFLLTAIPIVLLTAACAIVTCQASVLRGKSIKGSGRIVTRTLPAPEYNAVSASRAVKVVLAEQASEIRIDADDNFIDQVVVGKKGRTLRITVDKSVSQISNADITVTVPARGGKIHTLEASSSAKITSEVPLQAGQAYIRASSAAEIRADYRADRCTAAASSAAKIVTKVETSGACDFEASSAADIEAELRAGSCSFGASSSAKIKADIEVAACEATASGAAKIKLAGETARFDAHASSAAAIRAGDLTATRADVEASSGSSISVNCTETLKAQASSGAGIRYRGECKVEASESSGGSIRQK